MDGLVWVYGSCEPGAEQEAATTSMERLRIPPMENGITVPWFMRDLPYGVDTFVENVSLLTSSLVMTALQAQLLGVNLTLLTSRGCPGQVCL